MRNIQTEHINVSHLYFSWVIYITLVPNKTWRGRLGRTKIWRKWWETATLMVGMDETTHLWGKQSFRSGRMGWDFSKCIMSKSLKVVLSLHQFGGECGPLVSILVSNIQECFLGGVCNGTAAKIQKSQTWNCACEARDPTTKGEHGILFPRIWTLEGPSNFNTRRTIDWVFLGKTASIFVIKFILMTHKVWFESRRYHVTWTSF